MADAEVFDLDAVRAAAMEANPVEYRTLKMYGKEWRVRPAPNVMTVMEFAESGGTEGQVKFLLSYVHADERREFAQQLANDEALDEKVLEALIEFLTGATIGRPTEESSDSASGSSPTGKKSKADSSPEAPPVD